MDKIYKTGTTPGSGTYDCTNCHTKVHLGSGDTMPPFRPMDQLSRNLFPLRLVSCALRLLTPKAPQRKIKDFFIIAFV